MRITCESKQNLVSEPPESYPMHEHIISITSNDTTNCTLVTWMFPNRQMVQMIFHSLENAELFTLSNQLVLPYEGEDGEFYTRDEINLFLSQIKKYVG